MSVSNYVSMKDHLEIKIKKTRNTIILFLVISLIWLIGLSTAIIISHRNRIDLMQEAPLVAAYVSLCFFPIMLLVVFLVMTSLRQNKAFLFLENQLLNLFELNTTPMVLLDMDMTIHIMNHEARALLGLDSNSMTGMSILSYFDKEKDQTFSRFQAAVSDAILYGKPTHRMTLLVKGKSGNLTLSYNVDSMKRQEGVFAAVSLTNISEKQNLQIKNELMVALFKLMAEVSEQAVFVHDPHDHIILWNEKAKDYLEKMEDQTKVRDLFGYLAPDEDRFKLLQLYKSAAHEEKQTFSVDLHDGGQVEGTMMVHIRRLPIRNEAYGVIAVEPVRDIKNEMLALETMRIDNLVMKEVFNNTPSLIVVLDMKGKVVHMNKSRRMADPLEPFRVNHFDLIIDCMNHIEEIMSGHGPIWCRHCGVQDGIISSLKTGRSVYRKEAVFNHNGLEKDQIYVMYSTAIIESHPQKLIMVTVEDVTEQKRSKREVIAREIQYKRLFEASRDGIALMSLSGHYIEANKAFLELVGYEYGDLVGMDYRQITPIEWVDIEDRFITEDLMISGFLSSYEKQFIHRDGYKVDVELTAFMVSDELGGEAMICTIVRDTSEKKVLVQQVRESQKMQSIGLLAGGIAHDFNNILAGMIGYTELALLEQLPGSKTYRYLMNISQAQERAKHLVRQILTFSRQGSSEKEVLYINDVLCEVVELMRASLPSSVNLTIDIEPMVSVYADPTNIHEVVMNLFTNAAYATKEKGNISISLFTEVITKPIMGIIDRIRPDEYVIIEVKDDGDGIEPRYLRTIFDPFFTTKRDGKGTGLGLSVVYGIMQSHDGNIQVESLLGLGTTVRVYFPISHELPPQKTLPVTKDEDRSLKVLFVDDEPVLVNLASEIFKKLGHKVVTVQEPDHAYHILSNTHDFDVLISDFSMPKMNGLELVEAVRNQNVDIPAIICSGNMDMVNEYLRPEHGVRKVLQKPMTIYEIKEALQQI